MVLTCHPALNLLTGAIIKAAIEVHRHLGPGLLESVYVACLVHELRTMKLEVVTGKPVPLRYKDVELDCGFRLDVLVDDKVVVEVKSVSTLAPVHAAQVLTYLKLTGCPAGLLINFNVPVLKQGVRRVLNHPPTE
jgi:GxxExxY protein